MSTAARSILEALREDILSGALPPGEPLRQESLSQRYGVSRLPVRQALQRLEVEGLAHAEGRRGMVVARLDPLEAEDIALMRARLEPLALELAYPRLSKADLGRAEDLADAMQAEQDSARYGSLNWEFHRALYLPGGRPRLLATLEGLHRQADRYLRFQYHVLHHTDQSHLEHLELIRALRARHLPEALEILRGHITRAGEQLSAFLSQAPREDPACPPTD
ncbi:DNA-binding GntR family transcriptional regulator [Deinobacterium chartae]|uniref:DNA-binding GntR family transcriptional regulator n=1 Tax=Deinobacterium chartae TaxID=521158 RepID=A0A841I626_9DEIO|nr:GntR family transcriptional regulator [Deinobacterium chartae]MBB6099372.1 DNA-binding GntR family transcriptional regulator [Deinobacterium chartae]